MTLRGRLTAAFLAVVLGPVLLGAVFVGLTVTAVAHQRSADRLNLAANTVRVSISSLCRQLHATATAIALVPDRAAQAGVAARVVEQGLASAVLVSDATGATVLTTPNPPTGEWADCHGSGPTGAPLRAIAARIELRDASGGPAGVVSTAKILDAAFVAGLAATTGAAVTLLRTSAPDAIEASTESGADRATVLAAADQLNGDGVAETPGHRYVRRVGPSPGQPLPLVLSVHRQPPRPVYAVLVIAVLLTGVVAAFLAGRLARSTTRPLAELARAADRVADGDLSVRVPVFAPDELGRLANTFNRMTRETQSYVHALTLSRDQLRGHLTVLGDTLASTHDLERILQVILRTAIAVTGARAGLVLLLDRTTGNLVSKCAEGLAGRAPGDAQVPFGAGLLGAVAATGEPRRGVIHRDGPVLSPAEPRCSTYIAIPFSEPGTPHPPEREGSPVRPLPAGPATVAGRWPSNPPTRPAGRPTPARSPHATPPAHATPPGHATVPVHATAAPAASASHPAAAPHVFLPGGAPTPGVLGVLALYDRHGSDEFDDADLVTLRTFARHAAVAVGNVRVHEEAQRLSLTDPLTGLWNYRYLTESVRREVERASRFGRMLSVLALDLDRFKEVNDTYGHAAGDIVLAEFARRIRNLVREVDLAFRRGGEEFVVLLPETDATGATKVAERLGATVRDTPIVVDGRTHPAGNRSRLPISVTVSIGIAVFPDHALTGPQVLEAADEALYAAKAAGRDTHRIAVRRARPYREELPVPSEAATPDDGLPWAGAPPGGGPSGSPSGASSGAHPPRQSRGR